MRLVQLKSRWITGDIANWTVVSDSTEVQQLAQSRAPFGDFLDEYLKHRAIPWWRRIGWNAEWDVVEKLMRRLLNDHGTVVWIERKDSLSS